MKRTTSKTTRRTRSRKQTGDLHVTPMKSMGLFEASKKLRGVRFEETRELTTPERALWEQAKRGRGRPKKAPGEKAARVLITIAPGLLAAADDYARSRGISRAELIARGLLSVMPGVGKQPRSKRAS